MRKRPLARPSIRQVRSSCGISSVVSAAPHGPLLTLSANSCVPVGRSSSRNTQIMGGSRPDAMPACTATAERTRPACAPPKPCVQ